MACNESSDFQQAISHALQRLATPSMVLKPEQRASVKAVYEGGDVFVWLPTGFGKSVCYEALPFVFDFKLRTNAPLLGSGDFTVDIINGGPGSKPKTRRSKGQFRQSTRP